jgi:hypothetical protein
MADENRPLSELVAQGWEIAGFSSGRNSSGCLAHTVLLKKQRQHKILTLTRQPLLGLKARELDV